MGAGLRFCEGPVWLDDDRVLVTEIERGTLAVVSVRDGTVERVADGLAGPNGAAAVPDGSGRMWVSDNGGFFRWVEADGRLFPAAGNPAHRSGALLLVDPAAGTSAAVCAGVAGADLVAPNDLVVDADGGVWFSDFGVQDDTASAPRPGVVYVPGPAPGADADPGASHPPATPVVWGTHQANGIGLSPDGRTLYVAETHGANLWAFAVEGPGAVTGGGGPSARHDGRLLHRGSGVMFDSLAVDPDGWVCVATIGPGGGVTCVDPSSGEVARLGAPDELTTNVAFRVAADGRVRAVLTLSSTGALAVIDDWVTARQAARSH